MQRHSDRACGAVRGRGAMRHRSSHSIRRHLATCLHRRHAFADIYPLPSLPTFAPAPAHRSRRRSPCTVSACGHCNRSLRARYRRSRPCHHSSHSVGRRLATCLAPLPHLRLHPSTALPSSLCATTATPSLPPLAHHGPAANHAKRTATAAAAASFPIRSAGGAPPVFGTALTLSGSTCTALPPISPAPPLHSRHRSPRTVIACPSRNSSPRSSRLCRISFHSFRVRLAICVWRWRAMSLLTTHRPPFLPTFAAARLTPPLVAYSHRRGPPAPPHPIPLSAPPPPLPLLFEAVFGDSTPCRPANHHPLSLSASALLWPPLAAAAARPPPATMTTTSSPSSAPPPPPYLFC